jgi:D-arginine dehydrogenase
VQRADCIIIGSGIAGASAAYELATDRSVVLLEREDQPGYHSTGRSAALFAETYGNPVIRALTAASKHFLLSPPADFADTPLVTPRPILVIGSLAQKHLLDETLTDNAHLGTVQSVTCAQACALVPVLRPDLIAGGVLEAGAQDIDVHALHRGYLKGFGKRGGTLVRNAEVVAAGSRDGGWHVETTAGTYYAPLVVNAAGAWADVVAGLAGVAPVGLVPKRRSAFVFQAPAKYDTGSWPAVMDIEERFYFKPDAGMLLGSPANEDPVSPQDVQPEELDIAVAIDRIEGATTLKIGRIGRRWAGLRSFVADKTPVNGFDPDAPGFYWLAGQGGYGIQTASAMARLCAAMVRGEPLPEDMVRRGLDRAQLAPARLRRDAA